MDISLRHFVSRRITVAAFALLFFLVTLLSVHNPPTAYAATGQWIDAAHIKIGDQVYIDNRLFDSMDYFLGGVDSCAGTDLIRGFNKNFGEIGTDYTKAKLITRAPNPRKESDCDIVNEEIITLSSSDNALIMFHWVDKDTIESAFIEGGGGLIEEGAGLYRRLDGSNEFLSDASKGGCKNSLHVAGNDISHGELIQRILRCDESIKINVLIGSTSKASLAAGTGVPTVTRGDQTGSEQDNSCESVSGPLGWIMCPVAGLLDSVTGFLDSQIEQRLILKDDYFEGEAGKGLKAAWIQVRNISFAILVPIMLLMVIGTALGFEIFSAYSIKKALPRMVAAIIFITLSWYICLFLIDVVNVIGSGVKGLMLSPFSDLYDGPRSSLKGALDAANITTASSGHSAAHVLESSSSGAALGLIGALAVGAGFATGAISVSIIMSTLLSVAVVLGIVFLLLIARQMLLIALLIVAPLAVLAWIFPDNTKLWKLWWDGFTKLLLLFPVIMLVVAVGQVFALVAGQARGASDNTLVTSVIIIGAYVLPYFFIPFTFKWAGGLFGNIAGMVNDKERGVVDRLRKGRSEKRAQGWANFKAGTGTGFAQQNRLTRRVGTGIAAGVGGGKGVFGTGFTESQKLRGEARMDHINRENSIEQVMKNPAWNAVNQNDDALHAGIILQQKGMTRDRAIEYLKNNRGMKDHQQAENAVANWQASGLGGQAAAIAAAQQLVSTGTGYKDMSDMVATLGMAAGGNQNTAMALAGFANSETKKVGRHDLAPGFSKLSSLVSRAAAGRTTSDMASEINKASADTPQSSSVYELMNGKPQSLENQALVQKQILEDPESTLDEKLSASAFFREITSNLPNAKGGVRDSVIKIMQGKEDKFEKFDGLTNLINEFDKTSIEDPLNPGNTITAGEAVKQRVRAYERPDPDRINE